MTEKSPFDARKERLRAVFNRGSCTSRELLEADFGHWPPKGLNSAAAFSNKVYFRDLSFLSWGSIYADFKNDISRDIRQDKRLSDINSSNLFWRSIISLVCSFRTFNTLAFEVKKTPALVIRGTGHRNIYFSRRLIKPDLFSNVIAHEHAHILQNDFFMAGKTCAFDELNVKNIYNAASDVTRKKIDSRTKYLREEAEIQARLHTLLAAGYQKTGVMPATKAEFWHLLTQYGIVNPLELAPLFHTPELEAAKKAVLAKRTDFTNEKGMDVDSTEIWHVITKNLNEAQKEKIWLETLPTIYAGLLDLYGDHEMAQKIRSEPIPEFLRQTEFTKSKHQELARLKQEIQDLRANTPKPRS